MTTTSDAAPTTEHDTARRGAALLTRLEDWWLQPTDAAPLVLVRVAFGLVVLVWTLTLVPDFFLLYGSDGMNIGDPFSRWQLVTLFRWVDHPLVIGIVLLAVLAASILLVAGRSLRLSTAVVVVGYWSLIDYGSSWTIGAESVLDAIGLYLLLFALLTPATGQGRWPGRERGSGRGRAAGSIARWPLLLIQIQLLAVYLATGAEKLRGEEWREGSAVFHALEVENYRRFTPPSLLTDAEPVVRLLTWGTLVVEIGLPLLLLIPRFRRLGVLLVIGLHAGFDLYLELGFFGPAMIVGALAFLPAADAERVLRWLRWPFSRT